MNYTSRELREPAVEAAIVEDLRKKSEDDRLTKVKELTRVDSRVGLRIGRRVLTQKASFRALLEFGLDNSNESTIDDWLSSTVKALGFANVISQLNDELPAHQSGVRSTLYWLPKYGTSHSERARIAELAKRVNAMTAEGRKE